MEETVKDRLVQFLKSQGLSQKKFETAIGASNGYVNNIAKKIGSDKLHRINTEFPQLNIDWLISGNGEMLVDNDDESGAQNPLTMLNNALKVIQQQNEQIQTLLEIIREMQPQKREGGTTRIIRMWP